jgi:hypothetical protein
MNLYQTTRRHIPQDSILHGQYCEDLYSKVNMLHVHSVPGPRIESKPRQTRRIRLEAASTSREQFLNCCISASDVASGVSALGSS